MSLWLVLFLVSCLLTFRQVRAVGFDGIPGEYCSTRTSKCCPDRDDQCSAPILDNHLCYCDMFCNRSNGNDCCPDFKAVCGSETPEAVSGELMPFQSFNSFIVCSSILLIYVSSKIHFQQKLLPLNRNFSKTYSSQTLCAAHIQYLLVTS